MAIRRSLLKLLRRRRLERDLEAELVFHRDLASEHANPIGLGSMLRIREEARDVWRFALIEDFWRDVSCGVRSLRRTPAFAAIAILTIALGIGANTAIFTVIHRVMLASLPVREPSQLIEILVDRQGGPPGTAYSYQALQDFRGQTRSCSAIIGFSNTAFHVLLGGTMERVAGQFVTGDYFSVLGVDMLRGRPIGPDDDRAGAENTVAVVSHAVWQERFGARPDVIGTAVVIQSVPFTIIGVAPAGFDGLEVGRRNDIWIPVESERAIRQPSYTSSPAFKWLQFVGRLRPGVTMDQARGELRDVYRRTVIEHEIATLSDDPRVDASFAARMRTWSVVLESAGTGLSRQEYDRPLFVLMAIVVGLLLIACSNVANLLFARALAREREIALRLSLGAGRARLIRQLLTESAVLGAAGGTLGLAVATVISTFLARFLANSNPPLVLDVSPSPATLAFTAAVAIVTVVLFGLAPAFRSTDMDVAVPLKGAVPGGQGAARRRWSRALVVGQVALLLVLVVGAGLFIRTLQNLNAIDLGFDRSNVLIAVIDPFGSPHSQAQLATLTAQILGRIEALPGVRTASVSQFAPITGGSGINLDFTANREGAGPALARGVWVNRVGPHYFATLGIPVLAGREFDSHDSRPAPRVAIVNQAFADRLFGPASPVGQTITERGTSMQVVGVVGNAKYADIREAAQPTVYYNVFQQFGMPLQAFIRTDRDPAAVAAAVRTEVRSLMGTVAIRERTLDDQINGSIVRERLVTSLAALFGGLALVLAMIGLYGVVSHSVARRTKEIGIRIALGFDQRGAVLMVLREVLLLVGAGTLAGLPIALLVARSAGSLLYGLSPNDPATVAASIAALLTAAVAAGFIPARRASRVDPAVALRAE